MESTAQKYFNKYKIYSNYLRLQGWLQTLSNDKMENFLVWQHLQIVNQVIFNNLGGQQFFLLNFTNNFYKEKHSKQQNITKGWYSIKQRYKT